MFSRPLPRTLTLPCPTRHHQTTRDTYAASASAESHQSHFLPGNEEISVAELTRQLKRKQKDLDSAKSQLASQTRQIESLSKRNKKMVDATTKSQTDLREQRKQSVREETDTAKVVRELEEQVEGAEAKAASFVEAELEKQAVSSLVFVVIKIFTYHLPLLFYLCRRNMVDM